MTAWTAFWGLDRPAAPGPTLVAVNDGLPAPWSWHRLPPPADPRTRAQERVDYLSYINGPAWRARKARYRGQLRRRLRRWRCWGCGMSGQRVRLDVHHLDYTHFGRGRERFHELMPLCRRCHSDPRVHLHRRAGGG